MSSPASSLTATAKNVRIESIDLLRGVVMLIMALDHVRDYFHQGAFLYDPTDLTHTTPVVFFTRWITHFCAPVFTFLAGTSAFLSRSRKTTRELSWFLFTRGVWLVVLETLVVTPGWTFNPYVVLIWQVIWSIGISMICLSVLVYLPIRYILLIGIACIAAHDLLDNVRVAGEGTGAFSWAILHEQKFFQFSHAGIFVGYPVLPWIGVMAAGYCFGQLYAPAVDAAKRKKILIRLGVGAIVLFVIVRTLNFYGDPKPWLPQHNSAFTLLSFLNTSKYPPSFLYLLMTLGPSFLFLAYTEKPLNRFAKMIVVFGRVPLFFYIVHIYVIHLLAIGGALLCGYKSSDMVISTWVTLSPGLKGYGFGLPVVYTIWILLLIGLYPLCKWYDRYKSAHRANKWLSYL
jgi:uncharacterized membrane protein